MAKIGLVCDSTCDLPLKIIEQYKIGIIPVNIIFNNDEIRQQYENLTNEEFYKRLIAGEKVTTGVPAPGIIQNRIDAFLKKNTELIIITLSSKLSGLNQVINLVVKQYFSDKVTVIDSLSGTIETGLVGLIAARELAKERSRKEVADYLLKEIIPHIHLISYAADLKYLRRSGRIGRLTHLLGKVLRIKPIFHIENGEIVSPGKIMLRQDIDEAFKKLIVKVAGNQKIETIFIAHSGNAKKCQQLIDYLKLQPKAPKEILMAEVGPAVGAHVGPNTFGFVWVGNYSNDWFKEL